MANVIVRHIPNGITCCNLIAGCVATGEAFLAHYKTAFLFILIGTLFDFFDGMTARLLKVSSPIGKELDSLADVVTFGVAPSAMIFCLFREASCPAFLGGLSGVVPYTAFLLAAFSALRLAKFNLDTRQTSSFIGVPTPANTLFWASLIVGCHDVLVSPPFNVLFLLLAVCVSCYLLVAELPLFALKFKDFTWRSNRIKYVFLVTSIPILAVLGVGGFAAVIAWYVLLSAIAAKWHLQ